MQVLEVGKETAEQVSGKPKFFFAKTSTYFSEGEDSSEAEHCLSGDS